MFKASGRYRKIVASLALAILVIVVCVVLFSPTVSADTAGNEGSFTMSANGAVASISVENVWCPYGGDITAYLKNSGGSTLATGSASGSFGDETVTMHFDEVMVYSGQTYSIEIVFNPVADGSYGNAYMTYTPYYLIEVNNAYYVTNSSYIRSGSDFATSVSSPISNGVGAQIVCTGYSIDGGSAVAGTSYTFTTVTSDHTITYNWQQQFQVTYSTTGLDSSAQGTVVTVDGALKTYTDLHFTKWVNAGASTSFTFTPTVSSSTTGQQFRFSYSTYTTGLIVNAPYTIQGTYVTQYLLTVSTSQSSPTGASGYYDVGTYVQISVYVHEVSGGEGIKYIFANWTGVGTGSYSGSTVAPSFYMNGAITETANWATQYYLDVSGVYSTTTGSGWYNAGATAYFNVSSPVSSGGAQISFQRWAGTGTGSYSGTTQYSSVTMNAAITETANWDSQYYLTVSSPYGTTTGSGWYSLGATAYAGLVSGTVSEGTGKQYVFQGWSNGGTNASQSPAITITGTTTVYASWSTQYYLTVVSAHGIASGQNWYNVGAVTHAGLNTNSDGGYTFTGWSGDASGSIYSSSNAITMSAPKTATANWVGASTPSGPATYNVTIKGPYSENGVPAAGDTAIFYLSFANNTIYSHNVTSTVGVAGSIFISSTSPFTQLTWNASSTSSTLNSTRVYRFAQGAHGINDSVVNLYILDPSKPAYQYTFSVSDYYGMITPFLQTNVSPDGTNSYVVERVNLNETGGYVTFVMQQYQVYTLTFICQQGTYSQTFTAQTLGTPGQLSIGLNVLAGNFPSSNNTTTITTSGNRTSDTNIIATYLDPSGNTTWVAFSITHLQGSTTITDYTTNLTGNSQTFTWGLADKYTAYTLTFTALTAGNSYSQTIVIPSSAGTNPWAGIDWSVIGEYIPTLPATYTGWGGIDPTQIIAGMIILVALGIGSFYSTVASMFISWAIAGILWALGWWQGSVFSLVFAFVITVFVAFEEYKKGAFNL